jgi:hypothetical protein
MKMDVLEEMILWDGFRRFYVDTQPTAPPEPKSNAEQLAAMGFTVTKE